MNISYDEPHAVITLSERNLRQLLGGLERDGKAALSRQCGALTLVVVAQKDDQHYDGRIPVPGVAGL